MRRYRVTMLEGGAVMVPHLEGAWVRFEDCVEAMAVAAEHAVERDRFRSALSDIANVPVTLPNSAAGVERARRELYEARITANGDQS